MYLTCKLLSLQYLIFKLLIIFYYCRFFLYMKLLLLMGLPWIAELISWVVGGPSYYWYLTDIINLLRAVFIFAVFCCKKQVNWWKCFLVTSAIFIYKNYCREIFTMLQMTFVGFNRAKEKIWHYAHSSH